MVKAVGFEVVLAHDYARRLMQLIPTAKNRIVLSAMAVRAGVQTGHILQLVVAAARRGVAVHVVADIFSQHMASRPDYLDRRGFKAECVETREFLNEIRALGGNVDWVGRIGLNPYAGRYHAKMTIIDDHVFSFGGINFCDDSLQNIDYMLYVRNKAIADTLQHLVASNSHNAPKTDITLPLDAMQTLLFDAGQKGSSIIYRRACQLAAQATRVTYISQMCPSGPLAGLIKNMSNTCYFNRPAQSGMRPDTLAQLWDNWRSGITNHFTGQAYIHAKIMLFELKDGTKAVLSGSHNFSWRGVAFGTREIALVSSDPELWRKAHDIVYAVATAERTRYNANNGYSKQTES